MNLWYPKANIITPPLTTLGNYEGGHPRGAIVHYTAGASGSSAIETARVHGYTYFVIDELAVVHQGFPLSRWGSHAGESFWPSLGSMVSSRLVGIEIVCAGMVMPDGNGNFRTWWGTIVPHENVRVVVAPSENQTPGAYHIYTSAQEEALGELLIWLRGNAPDVFSADLVLGHDEVAPHRKQDPGGSLSMTMPALRAWLAKNS